MLDNFGLLCYFVANLRTFWCTFTGLKYAAVLKIDEYHICTYTYPLNSLHIKWWHNLWTASNKITFSIILMLWLRILINTMKLLRRLIGRNGNLQHISRVVNRWSATFKSWVCGTANPVKSGPGWLFTRLMMMIHFSLKTFTPIQNICNATRGKQSSRIITTHLVLSLPFPPPASLYASRHLSVETPKTLCCPKFCPKLSPAHFSASVQSRI